jgi:hypothetical protein
VVAHACAAKKLINNADATDTMSCHPDFMNVAPRMASRMAAAQSMNCATMMTEDNGHLYKSSKPDLPGQWHAIKCPITVAVTINAQPTRTGSCQQQLKP